MRRSTTSCEIGVGTGDQLLDPLDGRARDVKRLPDERIRGGDVHRDVKPQNFSGCRLRALAGKLGHPDIMPLVRRGVTRLQLARVAGRRQGHGWRRIFASAKAKKIAHAP
jgi:hypothetical protein